MNWVILVIAGLFEVAFASCLGKARIATGNDVYFWYTGFFGLPYDQHGTTDQSHTEPAHRHRLCRVDGDRCCWDGLDGDLCI